jgi:hypothetical protein
MTTTPLEPDPSDPSVRPVDPGTPSEDPPVDPAANPGSTDPDPTEP